jgi:hypothetical protein
MLTDCAPFQVYKPPSFCDPKLIIKKTFDPAGTKLTTLPPIVAKLKLSISPTAIFYPTPIIHALRLLPEILVTGTERSPPSFTIELLWVCGSGKAAPPEPPPPKDN